MAQQHKTIKHLCCKPLTHIMCLSETADLNVFSPKETTEEKPKDRNISYMQHLQLINQKQEEAQIEC